MLADAAQVQGGKLYILGGGFEMIRARSMPVIHRNINLALIVEVGPEERNQDLDLIIDLIDEDGKALGRAGEGTAPGQGPAQPAAGRTQRRAARQPVLQRALSRGEGLHLRDPPRGRRAGQGAIPGRPYAVTERSAPAPRSSRFPT